MRIAIATVIALVLLLGCEGEKLELSEYLRIKATEDHNFTIKRFVDYRNTGYDQDVLRVSLKSRDGFECNIFINYARLSGRMSPFAIPQQGDLAHATLQLIDTKAREDAIFGPDDDTNFSGTTYEGLVVEIENYEDYVLTGTVKGPIKTMTGRMENISGEFRLSVAVVRE